jgi:acid phosphatase family membrane protein YuiD
LRNQSVVAAATAIAFERGFADSIFGLTVVYAGLIMYDAQVK